jgi:hypothetical protein
MHYISDFVKRKDNSEFSQKKSKKPKKTGLSWLDNLNDISQKTSELRKTISTGTRVSQELRGWGSSLRNAAREKRRELNAIREAELYKNSPKKRKFFGFGRN